MAVLVFVDGQCQGDGFKLSWVKCGNQFMDQFPNAAAAPLYVNMFLIFALPLAFVALVIAEVIVRKRKDWAISPPSLIGSPALPDGYTERTY